MRTPVLNFIAILILSFIFSCKCDDEIKLFTEEDFIPFLAEVDLVNDTVVISFNKDLNTNQVKLNENVFIRIVGEDYYDGVFEKSPSELRFSVCDLGCEDPDVCEIEIKLEGEQSDSEVIVSSQHQVLDGDMDGSDGGDFLATVSASCLPPTVIPPKVSSFTVYEGWDSVWVEIQFSEVMDIETFIPDSTVFLTFENSPIDFKILTTSDSDVIWLEILNTALTSCLPSVICPVNLKILGNGAKDINGVFLDGDCDGTEGEDYITDFMAVIYATFCIISPPYGSTQDKHTIYHDSAEFKLTFDNPPLPSSIIPSVNAYLINKDNGNNVEFEVYPVWNNDNQVWIQMLYSAQTVCAPDSSCTLELTIYNAESTNPTLIFDENCDGSSPFGNPYIHTVELSYF